MSSIKNIGAVKAYNNGSNASTGSMKTHLSFRRLMYLLSQLVKFLYFSGFYSRRGNAM